MRRCCGVCGAHAGAGAGAGTSSIGERESGEEWTAPRSTHRPTNLRLLPYSRTTRTSHSGVPGQAAVWCAEEPRKPSESTAAMLRTTLARTFALCSRAAGDASSTSRPAAAAAALAAEVRRLLGGIEAGAGVVRDGTTCGCALCRRVCHHGLQRTRTPRSAARLRGADVASAGFGWHGRRPSTSEPYKRSLPAVPARQALDGPLQPLRPAHAAPCVAAARWIWEDVSPDVGSL